MPVTIIGALVAILAILAYAFLQPQSFMNWVICAAIDFIASLFPSTPSGYHIADILSSGISALGSAVPAVGTGVIAIIVNSVVIILGISLIIKIYKLMPFTFK